MAAFRIKIAMKNNNTLVSQLGVEAVAAVSLCLATGANSAMQGGGYSQQPQGNPPTTRPAMAPATKTDTAKKGNLSDKDKKFMMNAAKGGMMEVEWGKLAAQNGQNADVKKFGNRMVTDHSKANNELMALAREEGVSLPAAKPAGKWKSDKDYMDMMVKDHTGDLAEFQKEAQSGTDPDLKAFAAKYPKVVAAHLKMAQATQGKVK